MISKFVNNKKISTAIKVIRVVKRKWSISIFKCCPINEPLRVER